MALCKEDYKKELYKLFNDKDCIKYAFSSSIDFAKSNIEFADYFVNTYEKVYSSLEETYKLIQSCNYDSLATIYKESKITKEYLEWYKKTYLNKEELIAYCEQLLEQSEKEKNELLEMIKTTEYESAVRDLLNENKNELKYDIFSKIENENAIPNFLSLAIDVINTNKIKNEFLEISVHNLTKNHIYYKEMLLNDKYIKTSKEIKELIDYICFINEKIDKNKDKEKQKFKYEFIPLPLEYPTTATIASTSLINEIAVNKFNDITLKDNYLINNLHYDLEQESIEKSQKIIGNLNELDIFVLNTITIDFILKQNKWTFSDYELANLYTQKGGKVTPIRKIKEDVNKSIIKLQNTRISLSGKSVEIFKKQHIKISGKNPLLWVENVEVKSGNTTNYYRAIKVPFYLNYLEATNSELITYNRELLYLDIKGIDKSPNNQDLRYYLIRRLAPLKSYPNEIYITTNDIYEVQHATAEYYPNPTNLKKARQRVREHTEILLKQMKKEYNFTYRKDVNKRVRGFFIIPKKEK